VEWLDPNSEKITADNQSRIYGMYLSQYFLITHVYCSGVCSSINEVDIL